MCGNDNKQSFRLFPRQQSFNVTFDHLENHQLQSKESQMDNYNEYTVKMLTFVCQGTVNIY